MKTPKRKQECQSCGELCSRRTRCVKCELLLCRHCFRHGFRVSKKAAS